MKKQAICYNSLGWWRFYKTEDGHSFTVRDNKDYWYNGNVITGEKANECYIEKKHLDELFEKIVFVN
jgi:hypothetical protein